MSNSKSDFSSSGDDMSQNFQKSGVNDEDMENLTENLTNCGLGENKKEISGRDQPSGSKSDGTPIASTPKKNSNQQGQDESLNISNIAKNTSELEPTTLQANITQERSLLINSLDEFNKSSDERLLQEKIMKIVENVVKEGKLYKFVLTKKPDFLDEIFNFSFPFYSNKSKDDADTMLNAMNEICTNHTNKMISDFLCTKGYSSPRNDATSTFTVRLLFREIDVEKVNLYKYYIQSEITSDCFDELNMLPDALIERLLSKLTKKKELSTFDTDENIENFFANLNGIEVDADSKMSIMDIIELVAKTNNKRFFIGLTTKAKYTNGYKYRFNLYTTYFGEKADIMSYMIVYNCVFHENKIIRKNLTRKHGAGNTNNKFYKFFIFIAYNKIETTSGKTLTFQEGNLNEELINKLNEERDEKITVETLYACVVKKAIETVNEFLVKNRMITFGFSRTRKFKERMNFYQCSTAHECNPDARCTGKGNFFSIIQ